MNDNQIREIGTNTFAGSAVNYVDLSYNQLSTYNPDWMTPINETLQILLINRNTFTALPYFPFSDLGNLRELDISRNSFHSINDNTFLGLSSLQRLYMSDLNIVRVNRNWFAGLTELTSLYLGYNNIREIHPNDFDGLNNLRDLNLNSNDLTFINADGFGSSISTLVNLYLTFNRIVAIDEEFFDASSNLLWLLLSGNGCSNRNFYNIVEERDEAREELNECFGNFIGSARCQIFDLHPYPYECVLYIMNPTGRNFDQIIVEHGDNRTDNDVVVLEALSQHTRNFPSVICRQFVNLEEIFIEESQIEVIDASSFVDCGNIWKINLGYNRIVTIPDGTFANNPTLQILEVFVNRITTISEFKLFLNHFKKISFVSKNLNYCCFN